MTPEEIIKNYYHIDNVNEVAIYGDKVVEFMKMFAKQELGKRLSTLIPKKGWDCPTSPRNECDYTDENGHYDEDCCIYCGQPEERK